MSHHSINPDIEMLTELKKQAQDADETMVKKMFAKFQERGEEDTPRDWEPKAGVGPTGRFPEGKLTENDDGEIAFAVFRKDGKIIVDFGGPVSWFGMNPEQAKALAKILIKNSKKEQWSRS